MLRDLTISWKMKNQSTILRSSVEAEYWAMASTASELVWLKSLLTFLRFDYQEPMKLFCDSHSTIHRAANPIFHERTKHIKIDCYYIRGQVQINWKYCDNSSALAISTSRHFSKGTC